MASVTVFLAIFGLLTSKCHVLGNKNYARNLFNSYSNNNNCMEKGEFEQIWKDMDKSPKDGQLTIQEFSTGWSSDHLNDRSDVTFFFMEMDRNHDVHISNAEVDQMFVTFDIDNDGCSTLNEFEFTYDSLFNV